MSLFETRTIRIGVLSPLHIGGVEQRLTPFEYVIHGNYVYQISEEKLAALLLKNNLVEYYVAAVREEGHRFRLAAFLKDKRINVTEALLSELSGGRRSRLNDQSHPFQDYRPFVRDGMGTPYIPGTTIKGAIRTAILFNRLKLLKETDPRSFESRIVKRIDSAEPRLFRKRAPFESVQVDWLSSFELGDKTRSPNTDWLRMLHVSDAYAQQPIQTHLIPVVVLKRESLGWKRKTEPSGQPTTIWVESVPEGTLFTTQITWDRRLLNEFTKPGNVVGTLPQNVDEVLSQVRKWARAMHEFESNFSRDHGLGAWYKRNAPTFRIGFGSGMMGTTIGLLLSEDTRKKIRNLAGKNKENDVAPKSRRVWFRGNEVLPLGWATIEAS